MRENDIQGLTSPLDTPPVHIRIVREGATIKVAGEVDLWSAPAFTSALDDVAAEPRLIVDLREVTFMDSSGIHVLMHLAVKRELQGPFTILPSPPVFTVLQLTGLDSLPGIQIQPSA